MVHLGKMIPQLKSRQGRSSTEQTQPVQQTTSNKGKGKGKGRR